MPEKKDFHCSEGQKVQRTPLDFWTIPNAKKIKQKKMIWHKVLKSVLTAAEVQVVHVNGKKICLVKDAENYYATASNCPHAGASLEFGWCEKGYLVCPVHRNQYHLKNGRGAPGQGDYLPIYPVKEEKDFLLIGMKESWHNQFLTLFKAKN
jgi:3-phenylpropionate/trans-cinnamate dioxygenase ferredoxin subunit